MIGTYARRTRSDDYPWGPTAEQREAFCREILEQWGGPVGIDDRAPSKAGDPEFRDWWSSYLRMGASPAAAVALTRMNAQIDIRHILPTVRVPTLVVHRTGDRCLRVEEGRYVASLIPDAVMAELPGERSSAVCRRSGRAPARDRAVSELRARAARLQPTPGDRSCARCGVARANEAAMARLQQLVATEAARYGGRLVARHGDRVYAVFDGPARAIRCGCAISAVGRAADMPLKIGLHTGECDLRSGAAHELVGEVGSRVAALARTGEVLVARTVVDLVAGSGLRFRDRGAHRLAEGFTKWHVFAVDHDQTPARAVRARMQPAPRTCDPRRPGRRPPRIAHQILTARS